MTRPNYFKIKIVRTTMVKINDDVGYKISQKSEICNILCCSLNDNLEEFLLKPIHINDKGEITTGKQEIHTYKHEDVVILSLDDVLIEYNRKKTAEVDF